MDGFILAVFLALAMFVVFLFFVYVICFMAWHHLRIKQRATKLLLIHSVLELFFTVFSILGFLANFHSLLLFCIGIDFLLVAWIAFDSLYGNFFYDGAKYKRVVTKPFAVFLLLWAVSNCIIGYYDLFGNVNLRYTIPGFLFLGLILVVQIIHRDMLQLKDLREYVDVEIEHVEIGDKWKVMLVSKQYKFLFLQFPANILGLLAFVTGLVVVVIEGLSLLATLLFSTSIVFFMIGKGCQLLGFFYPVPQWREALEGR